MKERIYIRCCCCANILNTGKRFLTLDLQFPKITEMTHQFSCRAAAHIPDSQAGQKTHRIILLRSFDLFQKLIGVLFLSDNSLFDQLVSFFFQMIYITVITQVSFSDKRVDKRFPQSHYIHRIP